MATISERLRKIAVGTVTPSCGCVFCDLGLDPKCEPGGDSMHVVQANGEWHAVLCRRPDAALSRARKE